jgi:hypothetical protein
MDMLKKMLVGLMLVLAIGGIARADETDFWKTFLNDTGAGTEIIDANDFNAINLHLTGNYYPRESTGARSTREVFSLGSGSYPWKDLYLAGNISGIANASITNATIGTLALTSISGNWTNAGNTIADLGIVTTASFTAATIGNLTVNNPTQFAGIGIGQAGVSNKILLGSTASTTDYPRAQVIFSEGDSGGTSTKYIGLIGESVADGSYAAAGLSGWGLTSAAYNAMGVSGYGKVASATNAGIAYGGYFSSTDTHTGANNVAVYAEANNASSSGLNYALYLASGDIRIASASNIKDAGDQSIIAFPTTVSNAVNYLTISNAATNLVPDISATGGDTNIGMTFTPKGTGIGRMVLSSLWQHSYGTEKGLIFATNFMEGTGTTLYAGGLYGGIGTITAGAGGWTAGRYGGAYNFDGSTSLVLFPHDTNFDFGTGSFAVEIWVRPGFSDSSADHSVIGNGDGEVGGAYPGWQIYWNKYYGWTFVCGNGTSFNRIYQNSSSANRNTATWYHLVGVRDGTNVKLYVNGREYSTSDGGYNVTNTRGVRIGCEYTFQNTAFFSGDVGRAVIYNRALNKEEVANHCDRGQSNGIIYTNNFRMIGSMGTQLLGIDSDGSITDANNAEILKFKQIASATCELTISNGTGAGPSLEATGNPTNIPLTIFSKGSGLLSLNTVSTGGTTIGNATGTLTINGPWSAADKTCANLGTVTTMDVNGGTIDDATIATSNVTVGSGKTLDVSAGTLTLAANQISGDKVEGGTINATTINTLIIGTDIYTTALTDYSSSSTVVGWAATPTKEIIYKTIGKEVHVYYYITGTSNSTEATFTVPLTSHATLPSNGTACHTAMAADNGATANGGYILLPKDSATVSCYKTISAGAWTASGTKSVQGEFFYPIP